MRGVSWKKVLQTDRDTRSALEQVLRSTRPVHLPPFLLQPAAGTELAVAGMYLAGAAATASASLLLWPAFSDDAVRFENPPAGGDVLAVLGVDRIRMSAGPQAVDELMRAIRHNLVQIMRPADGLSDVSGTSLVLVLRSLDTQGAKDVCRAMLSHLHRALRKSGSVGAPARLRVGLAAVAPGRPLLGALLAADRAMQQARVSWASQQVRIEDAADFLYLVGDAVVGGGIFGGRGDVSAQRAVQSRAPAVSPDMPPPIQPMERDIEGYVTDNMEGAVDQALFLARVDLPVAIIGPAGTGKMYVARVLHEATGAAADMLVQLDCREFRGRKQAEAAIARELSRARGRTLVFKSPHLMNADAQRKLARQISSRTLADVSPPRALAQVKFVALFPQPLPRLIRKGELTEALASVFAGFPINVPPIKDRKQAVLRWAHKILGQEGVRRDRDMKGFTPDAEQAMLIYDWPGNISEMRQCIRDAMDKTDKNWLTPVDLGLFEGIDPEGSSFVPESVPFLAGAQAADSPSDTYTPTTLESLDVALGQAVAGMLELDTLKPIGTWLDDELVFAVFERYRGDLPKSGEFLHTKPRNIGRWMPKIEQREEERNNSALWQTPRRLLREWVRESPQLDESPMLLLQGKLLAHIEEQAGGLSSARRATILGVSTPTYLKRLKEMSGA